MSSDLTLLSLPELVKIHILKELDYPSIQCLRKTCRDFLNLIDDTRLDIHAKEVYLTFCPTKFEFATNFSSGQNTLLEYSSSCTIKKDTSEAKEFLVAGENFQDVFWRDFELFTQQCSIKTLDFNVTGEITEWKFPPRIRVEEIMITSFYGNGIMDIIPFLDGKFLKSIYIFMRKRGVVPEINKVVMLPQWKNAEKLSIFNGCVDKKIDNFAHFLDVTVSVENFDLEDVMKIRSWFFSKNSKMTCFRLYFYNLGQDKAEFNRIKKFLIDQFGPQESDDSGNTTLWISEIPNSTKFLQMRLLGDALIFKRLDSKSQSDIGGY